MDIKEYLNKKTEELNKIKIHYGINDIPRSSVRGRKATISNIKLAYIHQYGIDRMPKRDFLTIYKPLENDLKDKYQKLVEDYYKEDLNADDVMNKFALYVQSALKLQLRNHNWVPNNRNTIRVKGSRKPLIDTGQLINSIIAEVVK